MKVALAGAGAFGVKHLEAIAKIDGVEVVSLVGRTLDATKEVAKRVRRGPRHDRARREPRAAGSSTR